MPRLHLAIFAGVLAAALGLAWLAWRSLDSRRVLLEQGAAETRRREAEAGALAWQERISARTAPLLALLAG
ncbi:MAG: hypothetical protein HUU15_18655, partial [Candidatus Brocadiae bacterium]|nr:hypothetical protein [Candidatus Brocadiia bacterium]